MRIAYTSDVPYRVGIDDNFHYQHECERLAHSQFETADAIAACKAIVDDFLAGAFEPGTSATALYDLYRGFGPDPSLSPCIQKSRLWSFLALGTMLGGGATR